MASSGRAAGIRTLVDGGRVLLVVERLSIRRGDLPGPGPLSIGEHLLLHLEVGPGVVVVQLGEGIRGMRLERRAPGSLATAAPGRGGGWGRARRDLSAGARRCQPGPERCVLVR